MDSISQYGLGVAAMDRRTSVWKATRRGGIARRPIPSRNSDCNLPVNGDWPP